jgi:pimeloyl-ACP methyl ester carboxylesterase
MRGLPTSSFFSGDGGTFEYVVAGVGRPSVILINGSGGPVEAWHKVWPALSEATTTLAYNRPGVGQSTKPLRPQTVATAVRELRALLVGVAVPRPWVPVGHSFGGLVANLFARLHAQDVAGVVLLEATSPDDVSLLKRHENALQRGLAWVANHLLPLNPNHETLHALQSVTEMAAAPAFPALPLRVISGARPALAWATSEELLALRARHQASLVGLSPLGIHIQATRSGHFPQFTEPNLVISTIQELVGAAH